MKHVYIVTDGEYSDYRICALFEDKEEAENYQAQICPQGEVEEWALGTEKGVTLRGDGRVRWSLTMNRDGSLTDDIYGHPSVPRREAGWNKWNGDPLPCAAWDRDYPKEKTPISLYVECWARDEKHAVKIANEIRTRTIADRSWDKAEAEIGCDFNSLRSLTGCKELA